MASSVSNFRLISNAAFAGVPVSNRVWATTASEDPIKMAVEANHLSLDNLFGKDPVDPSFGARIFASDSSAASPHSAYWDADSSSRVAIGHIIAGQADCGFRDNWTASDTSSQCSVSWTPR
jgi:hypothetical protein